ncbi:MAG: ABC transporter permease [Acidobacteriaceae bacterium]|nr:ABC transporter permease [Acidobacteriaceae bacterium]
MSLFRRRRYTDLEVSISEHIAEAVEELMAEGLSRKEAELAARRSFGNRTLIEESSREAWGWTRLESWWADVGYASRQLAKNPGFATTAVATLALGIAVNATMFSLVSAFLMPRLPGKDLARVYALSSVNPIAGDFAELNPVSAPNYLAWRSHTDTFSDVAAVNDYQSAGLTVNGQAESIRYSAVTPNYFGLLQARPALGRTFAKDEDVPGRNHVLVLSYALWAGRFASDAGIVGRTVRLGREDYTVIGVMPEDFRLLGFVPQLWTPLTVTAADRSAAARPDRDLYLFARLAPGVTPAQARSQLSALARRAEIEYPSSERRWGASMQALPEFLIRNFGIRKSLVVLMMTVSFILLIACANVAGLLLTRAARRQKELAIRLSIGASRMRIVRQLLTEGLVISLFGGGAGLLLAYAGIALLRANLSFNEAVNAVPIALDRKVLAYAMTISVVSALLSALTPAVKSARSDVNAGLKSETRGASADASQSRLRALLVVSEIALALVLLTGSGLLIRGIFQLEHQDLGFPTDHLLTATLKLDAAQYQGPAEERLFAKKLLTRLQQLPSVSNAALSSDLPGGDPSSSSFLIKGERENLTDAPPTALDVVVTSEYFEATRIPVLRGRVFTSADEANAPRAVLVNQEFARRFLGGRNPLGIQLKLSGKHAANTWSEIVGVVGDSKTDSEDVRIDPEIYEAFAQHPTGSLCLLLRTVGSPEALISSVRRAVAEIDPELPLASVATMRQFVEHNRRGNPLFVRILGMFALLALIMAAIGIYGMVAYSTSQRTHEIGIRMALGASRSGIFRTVLSGGLKTAAIGSAAGAALALPLPRVFDAMFSGIQFGAPIVYLVVLAVIVCVASAATCIPALRASKLDPAQCLRVQ